MTGFLAMVAREVKGCIEMDSVPRKVRVRMYTLLDQIGQEQARVDAEDEELRVAAEEITVGPSPESDSVTVKTLSGPLTIDKVAKLRRTRKPRKE